MQLALGILIGRRKASSEVTAAAHELLLPLEIGLGHGAREGLHQRYQRLLGRRPIDEPVGHRATQAQRARRVDLLATRSGTRQGRTAGARDCSARYTFHLRRAAKSRRHPVRKSNQKPVIASHTAAKPNSQISGWLKLARSV